MKINAFEKLAFGIKNLPCVRPFVERNRRLVGAYFNYKYRRNDPYEYSSSTHEEERMANIVQFINDKDYEKVLDVGCGEGYLTQKLRPVSREILGIDISSKAIERAKERLKGKSNIHFMTADILTLKFPGKFDLIVCSDVLYYLNLSQIQKVVQKLIDSLEPRGRLLLSNLFARAETKDGLELKNIGAATIHPMFLEMKKLKLIKSKTYPQYAMVLLKKI